MSADFDLIAEFQHRNRMLVHDIGSLWHILDGRWTLSKRDGEPDEWVLRQAMKASGCLAVAEGCDPLPNVLHDRYGAYVHPKHIDRYMKALVELGYEPKLVWTDWQQNGTVDAPPSVEQAALAGHARTQRIEKLRIEERRRRAAVAPDATVGE